MKEPHNKAVLDYLRKHKTITPLEALNKIGTMRLAARIHNLRKRGHQIETEMNYDSAGVPLYAKYILKEEAHE